MECASGAEEGLGIRQQQQQLLPLVVRTSSQYNNQVGLIVASSNNNQVGFVVASAVDSRVVALAAGILDNSHDQRSMGSEDIQMIRYDSIA